MPTTGGYGTKYAARSPERYEPDGQARPPRRRKTEGLLPPAGEAAVPFGPVPEAEKKLGIAIGGGYKFPNGKSDVEYHREQAIKHGGVDIFQQGD